MGLDTVELVMEFEDEFQISIPDRDAELIHTIGQTVDYIYERLLERRNFQEPIQCPAQHAFYKLRQGLISDMRVERRLICPAATIGSLLPERWQRRAWPRFARQHGLDAPRFQWATADRFHRPHETLGTLARELVEQGLAVLQRFGDRRRQVRDFSSRSDDHL